MKELREAFERALAEPGAIDAAIEVAQAFLAAHERHPVAMAYMGSLAGLKAGAATLPWVKLGYANDAAALLDAAYERRHEIAGAATDGEPEGELVILLLRGIAYANFPPFLGRAEAARECLEQATRHFALCGIPAVYRTLAFSHLAGLHRHALDPEIKSQAS